MQKVQILKAVTCLLSLCTVVVLSGCAGARSSRSGLLEPYRQDLPQGNYITKEMLSQVRTGMTQEQVRFALGAPLLVNLFQPDRWNYVFRYQHAGGQVDLRLLVVYFSKSNTLERMEGDDLPAAEDGSDNFLPGSRARLAR